MNTPFSISSCYHDKPSESNILTQIWLTARLLASPTFHRGVRRVHKKVHELQHGKDPAEMGGTNIDGEAGCHPAVRIQHADELAVPGGSDSQRFLNHYMEELKNQFRGTPKK